MSSRIRNRDIREYFMAGGPVLPESKRYDSLKADFIERAQAARSAAVESGAVPVAPRSRSRSTLYLGRAAAAAAVIILIVLGMGLASTYAMPGNPLYSVKRMTENVQEGLAIGPERKSNVYLSNASRRIDELDYAVGRGMKEWYFPLSVDAAASIVGAEREASSLDEENASRVRSRARSQAARLSPALEKVYPGLDRKQREELDKDMERLRRRLGNGGRETPGIEQQHEGREGNESPAPPGNEVENGGNQENGAHRQGKPLNEEQAPAGDDGSRRGSDSGQGSQRMDEESADGGGIQKGRAE